MVPIKVGEIAVSVGARLLQGDPESLIGSVSIDSRSLRPGDLFIPIKGASFDGHAFIPEAVVAGASGFFTEDDRWAAGVTGPPAVFKVDDSQQAFYDLAAVARSRLTAKVVGITGSTGKTSTKDILAALLEPVFKTVATAKNQNNEIGAPLTITKAQQETEVLIVEMGMRGLGQIAQLATLTRPEIGIITNIGLTHVGIVGSPDKIAAAKAELIEALPASGIAVLNYDDEWTPVLRKKTAAAIVTFGFGKGADVSAADIVYDELARPTWRLIMEGKCGPLVTLPVPGEHNIANALAAIAAARALVVEDDVIAGHLNDVVLSEMRLSFLKARSGATLINDAYNANPDSMSGALETLVKVKAGEGRHVAVLGLMAELGDKAEGAHREIGEKVADLRIDLLVTVGEEGAVIAAAAEAAGMAREAIVVCGTKESALAALDPLLSEGDVVLVKASRAAGFEFIVERLAEVA